MSKKQRKISIDGSTYIFIINSSVRISLKDILARQNYDLKKDFDFRILISYATMKKTSPL